MKNGFPIFLSIIALALGGGLLGGFGGYFLAIGFVGLFLFRDDV